jgi:hypothetical protein
MKLCCHRMLAFPVAKMVLENLNFWPRIMPLLSNLVDFSMVMESNTAAYCSITKASLRVPLEFMESNK